MTAKTIPIYFKVRPFADSAKLVPVDVGQGSEGGPSSGAALPVGIFLALLTNGQMCLSTRAFPFLRMPSIYFS